MNIGNELPEIHSFSYEARNSILWKYKDAISDNLQGKSQDYLDYINRMGGIHPPLSTVSPMRVSEALPLTKEVNMSTRRMVQVYVVDPDEQVPVDRALIYKSEAHITDLTDQELFYEIDLLNKLRNHNDYRVTLLNKKVKDRTEQLEPIRIKDLSMLVITLANFSRQ